MVVVSNTERSTFRRCRWQWDFSSKHRQNLTGVGSGPEQLELGSLIHRALADWIVDEDQQKENRLAAIFVSVAASRQKELSEAWENIKGVPIPSELLSGLHNVVELGIDMMRNYQLKYKTPVPEHMQYVSPEQEILVPVPGTEYQCKDCEAKILELIRFKRSPLINGTSYFISPEHCDTCNDKGYEYHYLSMTLDGLLQDEKGNLLVLEHKTYENRPDLRGLQMNDQFTGYAWGVRELGIGTVVGIAYDGMWKRHEPPKYMQKEKRKGVLDDLFIRKIIYKSNAALDEFGRNLTKEINDIANNPALYPNVPWQGCSDCSFIEPCRMRLLGEDPSGLIDLKFIQREEIIRGGTATKT